MPAPLDNNQIREALKTLPGWSLQGDKLHKAYRLGDFREALAFIVRVGLEAEERNHHPELFNVYNNVTIDLCTHDAGDKVTQKDIDLAKAIEKISPQ
ncbi:MAG: 4a-hydroxytetrahydrobiopterin dehydratase [Planctomycetota bacterium]